MGLFKRKCGHQASHPFRVRCTKAAGHTGLHNGRGLNWGADGRIKFAARKAGR